MSSSKQRLTTNRTNAIKSTGPTSETGKAVASQNAQRHGVFSSRLFLEDEDPAVFEALLMELQATLVPVGAIELALVERIAIAMWRQRRLITAETASLALKRRTRELARHASCSYSSALDSSVQEEDLQPYDQERIEWCKKVIPEIEALDKITLDALKKHAPHVWQQLVDDAEQDDEAPEQQVACHKNGVTGYVMELYDWCKTELQKAKDRPKLLAFVEQLKQKSLVLPIDQAHLFARYQTTLDNQLYKALKTLRETQEWRFKSLDTVSDPFRDVQKRAA